MNEILEELNPEQRQVALHTGHTLAIACPGAGKTKTMATKAALLLDQGDKVCAVTFTRDAALELRERIMKLAQPSGKPRLLVGTFHSVSLLMTTPISIRGNSAARSSQACAHRLHRRPIWSRKACEYPT